MRAHVAMSNISIEIITLINLVPCVPLLPSFQDTVNYFGVKAKSGEKEVAPSHVFMLWYEFCNDFKSAWVRQSKNISKER